MVNSIFKFFDNKLTTKLSQNNLNKKIPENYPLVILDPYSSIQKLHLYLSLYSPQLYPKLYPYIYPFFYSICNKKNHIRSLLRTKK